MCLLGWDMIEFNTGVLMVNLVTLADFEDMVLDGIGFEITTYSQVWAISAQSQIVTLQIYFRCFRLHLFSMQSQNTLILILCYILQKKR